MWWDNLNLNSTLWLAYLNNAVWWDILYGKVWNVNQYNTMWRDNLEQYIEEGLSETVQCGCIIWQGTVLKDNLDQ